MCAISCYNLYRYNARHWFNNYAQERSRCICICDPVFITCYMHAQVVVQKPRLHSKPMTSAWSAVLHMIESHHERNALIACATTPPRLPLIENCGVNTQRFSRPTYMDGLSLRNYFTAFEGQWVNHKVSAGGGGFGRAFALESLSSFRKKRPSCLGDLFLSALCLPGSAICVGSTIFVTRTTCA